MNDSDNPKSKLSRRTMVGAAAWAAPAIAITAASPAHAASTPPAPKVPDVEILNSKALENAFTGPGFYAAYYGSDGNGGTALKGMEIGATLDGLPATPASGAITVTLPTPFTFSGGANSKSFTPSGSAVSVALGAQDISVPFGTAPGKYIITVEYQGKTDTVTMTVIEGGTAWGWGTSTNGANGLGTAVTVPTQWSYSATHALGDNPSFTTYNAVAGARANMALYSDLYDDVISTGTAGKVRWRRGFNPDRIVTSNKGQPHGATFIWSTDGTLNAFGENDGDMFSLGDGSPTTGAGKSYTTPVAVGAKILEANPGKKVIAVHAAPLRAAYILDDKTVWWSGVNTGSAMGNNDPWSGVQHVATQTVTAAGTPLTDIVDIAFGDDSSLFLDGSGNLWGAGTAGTRSGVVQIPGFPTRSAKTLATSVPLPDGKQVKKIWGAISSYVVQATDNTLYYAGQNSNGQYSVGSQASAFGEWKQITVTVGTTVAEIAVNDNSAFYTMTDGTLYFAGNNIYGGLGNGTVTGNTLTMAKVNTNSKAKVVDFSLTYNNSYVAILK